MLLRKVFLPTHAPLIPLKGRPNPLILRDFPFREMRGERGQLKNLNFLLLALLLLFFLEFSNAQSRDLKYYLEHAKINSPLINKNRNESKIAALDLEQIKSILSKPEVNVEANVMLAPVVSHDNNTNHFKLAYDYADKYTGYDLASTDGGQYQAFVSVKQPLFTSSKYRVYLDKSDISHQLNENSIVLTLHEIEQLVGYQYIICLKSKIQIENSQSLIKEIDERLSILQKLVESALYKQTDLMLLQIEKQNYELTYKTFYDEYKNNLYDLNLICGINDTNWVDIQEVDFQIKADNTAHSQFLTSYKLDSLNIITEQTIHDLKYKPQLNLFANAGLNAVYLPSLNRLGLCAGVTFSWNIYDGNQQKIQREKSNINLQTLTFEKNNFVTQNTINKNKILNQINSLNQRANLAEEQINQYNKLLDVYSKELSQGEISVMDYKNFLKDITAKKQENLLLRMEKHALINAYNYWNY